jgi:hypothetical protein
LSDIFHEVDEEVRRERLQKLWDRYGIYIIALAVLFVVGIGAWRGYQWYENKKSAESGAQFENAVTLAEDGKHAEAEAAFAKVANEGTAGYRLLARLRAAAEIAQRDPQAAVRAYDDLAAAAGIEVAMRDLASLRAGLLLIDSAPFEEVRKRLEPLSEPGRAFRHTAREMLALSAWQAKDAAAMRRYVDMIANDADTPQATRSRVDVLSALIAPDEKS